MKESLTPRRIPRQRIEIPRIQGRARPVERAPGQVNRLPRPPRIGIHHPVRLDVSGAVRAQLRLVLVIIALLRTPCQPDRRAATTAAPDPGAAVRRRPRPRARQEVFSGALGVVVGVHGAALGQAGAADVGAPGAAGAAAHEGRGVHAADVGEAVGAGAGLEEVEVEAVGGWEEEQGEGY